MYNRVFYFSAHTAVTELKLHKIKPKSIMITWKKYPRGYFFAKKYPLGYFLHQLCSVTDVRLLAYLL